MVIDTSALVAILFDEPEREEFITAIANSRRAITSAGTLIECSVVVELRRGEPAGRELDLLLHRAGIDVIAVSNEQASIARSAWRLFGKGRHPAGLNYGDLFAYALAIDTGEPLLFKGDGFSRTDVLSARV